MKKIVVVAVLILLLFLAGCKKEAPPSTKNATAKPKVVTFTQQYLTKEGCDKIKPLKVILDKTKDAYKLNSKEVVWPEKFAGDSSTASCSVGSSIGQSVGLLYCKPVSVKKHVQITDEKGVITKTEDVAIKLELVLNGKVKEITQTTGKKTLTRYETTAENIKCFKK